MAEEKPKRKKILIIEDDSFLSGMYASRFNLEGFEVFIAEDGEKGFNMIQEKNPDLILLDVILPRWDGFEVLQKIKKDPSYRNIPVLLLTNLGQEEDIKRGKALGADDYLVKVHHTPDEVVSKVRSFVSRGN
ncbi:response regulator [bacterium (Candidatus Torokbacteria) CG_4_10_14_0_2_um_filter_35_8]|nr:MAG: response regulator [bacterium (Candidatus Torokbacteria) CG_4_10_14_0_2_um_filter_35_8]